MKYYTEDNRPLRRIASLATLLYVVALGLVMWLVSFEVTSASTVPEGLLINFGDSELSAGTEDLEATDSPQQVAQQSATASEQQMLTDDDSEVEVDNPTITEESTARVEDAQSSVQEVVAEKPRTVNQKALFPGRTLDSDSKGEGTGEQANGNQGDASGEKEGSSLGTGQGLTGDVWNLEGRSIVGHLPKPTYADDSYGTVIIEIAVDSFGRVRSATYRAKGSTTSSSKLIEAARTAAMSAQFSPDDNNPLQAGTITYNFKRN